MTPYYMRGRKRNLVERGGHSSAEDADRGAMAGGGRARGGAHEIKLDNEAIGSRKRKRGQTTADGEDEQMSLDEPNGNDDGIAGNFPKLDSTDLAKLLEVIEREFSLEILLKNRERKAIEAERAKVEISMKQLEQYVASGDATYHESPSRYHNYYNQYVEYGPRNVPLHNNGSVVPSSSARPQRNAAIKAAARNNSAGNICLAKNDKGKVVRVTCPDCSRFDFSNVQGFINHCRIAHKIEYASHDDAVRHCGVEVDLSEFGSEESTRPSMHMTRPGIQSILNTSSTLSGKLPETANTTHQRKLSGTSFDESDSFADFTTAFNEFVASPVTTRARAQSFNSMLANGDFASSLISGFNNSNNPVFSQPIIHNARRNSLPDSSKQNATISKRNGGSRVTSRRDTSNGMPSPAETDTTPTLKHLNKFVRSSSLEYDIDGFVEEMRREKHNNMLLGDDGISVSGDSDVEEKPQAKKPNTGVRRPTGPGRAPANWIPPVAGLVEVPATRLRNRQQKEKERLANATKVEPNLSNATADDAISETVSSKPGPKSIAASEDDILDIVTSEKSTPSRVRGTVPGRRRQSTSVRPRSVSNKPLKKSPMEEQAFLSTLPLRTKNRRRRTSINTSKSEIAISTNDQVVGLNQDDVDHDSDATSSEDELGKRRKAKRVDGTMTPTSHTAATGFVGLSCGKDAPNVHFVSPIKQTPDIISRPDLVDGSRYYVKRRIKIGNSSKFIPEAKRSAKMEKYTHKWMIYFVSPPYSAPISTFLSSVTIFLDESFPLPRIIELRVPPFRWVSYGWGEFNLNIRLVFCDPSKNKPMDVVHPLKLDPGKSGREVTGYEGYFDVELDRSSEFLPGEQGVEYDEVPRMAGVERAEGKGHHKNEKESKRNPMEEDIDADTIRGRDIRDMTIISPRNTSPAKSELEKRPILPKNGTYSDESVVERVSELDDAEIRQILDSLEPYAERLHEAVKKYPLTSVTAKLPYSVAPSNRVFLSWNIGRQKSVEWHRARIILNDIKTNFPLKEAVAGPDLTVKAVVVWCRQNRYGPSVALDDNDEQLHYCRYCGMIADSPPRKGQKRSKSSWGVDAYCRCGQNVTENLALMKTSSSVQDMISRNRRLVQSRYSAEDSMALTAREIRALLLHTDVNMLRWVWSSMLQLNLPTTQPKQNDHSSETDSLNATAIITQATRSFLSRLMHLARQQSSAPEPEDEDEVNLVGVTSKSLEQQQTTTAPLVVTPIHILRAIRAGRQFDFLTNAGMATGSPYQGNGGGTAES